MEQRAVRQEPEYADTEGASSDTHPNVPHTAHSDTTGRLEGHRAGFRWTWLVALLSLFCSASTVWAWHTRHTPATEQLRDAQEGVTVIMRRERIFYNTNHAYATSLDDLGLHRTPGDPWRYQIVATRVRGRPLLLVEAEDGQQRLSLDRDWRLYRSPIEPLPLIPEWRPEHGGKERHDPR